MPPKLIALEEHFDSGLFNVTDPLHSRMPEHITSRLHDIADLRTKDIDNGGLALQVLSHIGVPTPVEECRKANDMLAEACKKSSGKMAGFAMLPMQEPSLAAEELERCIKSHKFVGALINNHLEDGTRYEDERFWPVFAKAVELDVPIYIHPVYPGSNLKSHYDGPGLSDFSATMMATSAWGWHSETGLHVLRLFAAGLFDRFPKLKLVIGHMGEMLPYMLERTIHSTRLWGEFKRPLRTVWEENIWVTTSGLFSLPPLECLLKVSPKDKVMYSVDYPFSTTETGLEFVRKIEESGVLSKEEFEGFCFGNAERLLKVKV
ncbi:hypothetical protein PRZ48_000169 [Zasmidium cellare]|uniref:Amidohydrolase-related domain-containing protein n=1 Tax=Zasmidium cellare TaxID=395010 RepID=A0ABR0EY44_ZASCE|nr:hypothetical protein PRZ48_000169 [Zasmidium cellare]